MSEMRGEYPDLGPAGEEEPILGREPDFENLEPVEWARESIKMAVTRTTDVLRQLVTLTTALLAGSVGLMGQIQLPVWAKAAGTVLLLVALILALFGVIPQNVTVDVQYPDDIREFRERLLWKKKGALYLAAGALVAAFIAVGAGLIAH